MGHARFATEPPARGRILESARRLFYERAIRAVGVEAVVEDAGVTKMSLYRHFASKDELVAACLGERGGGVLDLVRRQAGRASGRAARPAPGVVPRPRQADDGAGLPRLPDDERRDRVPGARPPGLSGSRDAQARAAGAPLPAHCRG